MIVVDESVDNVLVLKAIADWYPGRVVSIRALRPATLIHDEVIPTLLHQAPQSTFVTINVDDFWKKTLPNQRYCIVALELNQGQASRLPLLLRRVFQHSEFQTKALRMGKVIYVTPSYIDYYEVDRKIRRLPQSY